MHTIRSKAIRFNGFTDGIVVPTGQFKESGISLLRPAYGGTTATTKSHATKIGRIHLPTESNPLNAILGPFTIEAFIVPNYGGTVVSKPGCFSLEVGDPFKNAPIKFSIHCIGRVFTVATSFDVNVLLESHSGTYSGGQHKPNDLTEWAQPLMMVCAQFTGDEMKVFVNGNLVASLNLIENRILDNVSSDLFIGGRGGEYRGLIESVRISRGIVEPLVQPFVNNDQTIGFWDFNDEISLPKFHFFNNRNETAESQGRDSSTYTSLIETPMVMLGYDFQNINDYGYFKVYDPPEHASSNDDKYTALEKLASYITGLDLIDVKKQTWYATSLNVNSATYGGSTGSLDYLASDRIKQSSLNAVINQSGTHPLTGLTKTATARLVNLTNGNNIATAVESDLDPMTNPIERVRIISLDFANNRVVCQSVHLTNDTGVSATIENHPKGQGLLFDHADGTPIWLTLGNADLIVDPGNKNTSAAVANQVSRQKDAFTRAEFTQGQRFEDRSGNRNTAYFTSVQSRITTGTAALTSINPEPDPPKDKLLMWINAGSITGVSDGATLTHVADQSGNLFGLYTVGTWVYEANSASFNSKPALRCTSADGALINIGTNDGESKQITHTGTSFTAFWFAAVNYNASYNTDLIGQNGGSPKTFFGISGASGNWFFTNNGTTTTNATSTDLTVPGLYSATFNAATTNTTVHYHSATETTFVAKITGTLSFANSLFTIFGRGASSDPAAKTGTATNKAIQNTRIAEFLLYEKSMTDAERQQVQGYFLDKYTVI